MEVAPGVGVCLEVALFRQPRLGRRREVRRAAQQPGDVRRQGVQDLGAGVAPGDALGVGVEGLDGGLPAFGQLAALEHIPLGGKLGVRLLISGEPGVPVGLLSRAPVDGAVSVGADFVGHQELGVGRPAIALLGQAYLFFAERLAVRRVRVLLVGRAPGDVAVNDDQRRALGLLLRRPDGLVEQRQVVGVADAHDVPVVRHEARRHVVAEGQPRVALDGDVIIIINPDEVAEPQVAGERRGLLRHAFHQAAVAGDGVDAVIDDLVTWAVKVRCQPSLGYRHADGIRHALAERPCGGLDAGRQAVLGVAGRLRLPLAEPLDLFERQVVAGDV